MPRFSLLKYKSMGSGRGTCILLQGGKSYFAIIALKSIFHAYPRWDAGFHIPIYISLLPSTLAINVLGLIGVDMGSLGIPNILTYLKARCPGCSIGYSKVKFVHNLINFIGL